MNALKIVALLLLLGGGLGLAYGGFSYTKATHNLDIGPMHMQVSEQQRVNVPIWAGLGALLLGGVLLLAGRKG